MYKVVVSVHALRKHWLLVTLFLAMDSRCWGAANVTMLYLFVDRQWFVVHEVGSPLMTSKTYFIFLADKYYRLTKVMLYFVEAVLEITGAGWVGGTLLMMVHSILAVSFWRTWSLQWKRDKEIEFFLSMHQSERIYCEFLLLKYSTVMPTPCLMLRPNDLILIVQTTTLER